ncbi:FeGP cofactor biosynthesis guanylyltransferase HcgB family protein [Desulfurobacterium thermolithotrophum]|uniref:FeGP cofactor biosynthesis guanylyltransferase HcgB family protein n=1 Tax=Desulfurobacterium thermolithotrophum TaxID=64160 RepID=UPI0013D13B5A|nr:FeGP cofactor biosynthesis guanylyltransferase HcgB family protein [Desulfurobacterium thermolithotrophum]
MLEEKLELFKDAFLESLVGNRKGDKPEETALLRERILKGKIGIVTNNKKKFTIAKKTISLFGIKNISQIEIPTEIFDLTEIPALSKALAGRFFKSCNFYIARGRLGAPGSGALTIMIDEFGHVISAVTSPPHHLHKFSLETSVFLDIFRLLKRLGFTPFHNGITKRTKTVYSSLTPLKIAEKISERKAIPLKNIRGKKLLIVGGYLDGIFFASILKNQFEKIHIFDIENSVLKLAGLLGLKSFFPKKEFVYDVILDLTGFGGAVCRDGKVSNFKGKMIISEIASGVQEFPKNGKPNFLLKLKKGKANTSGTMTLTVKTVRESAAKIEEIKGVLYAVPQLFFAESLLFNVKSAESFYELMEIPALTVSCKTETSLRTEDIDKKITEVIENFEFELERV